jgi:two-component system, cell cycle sensor histidine kinase PleC
MLLATPRSVHVLHPKSPLWRAGLAFTIDARIAALLDANAGARQLWAIDARSAMPFAVDAAMPAVQRLRQIANASQPDVGLEETLTFWTGRGIVHLACRLAAARVPGEPAIFKVRTLRQEEPNASSSPEAGSRRDVALAAWLGHELRTPLGAIIACAEILKNEHFGPCPNPRYRDYAQAIFDGAHHALGVVDAILRGNLAGSGVPELFFVDLDPTEVVASCLAVARPLADRAGLGLEAVFDSKLPHIIADELSLRQMLLNLIGNAIKFARRGDQIRVAVTYERDGPLTVSVVDTGPGIACEGADAQVSLHAAAMGGAGLGLGLPLTKALADANGAQLAIASEAGLGTRVTISFGKDRIVPV